MQLAAGTKLGPYEIISPIGAGGMGQVWKARDTRLDRIVAIKTTQVQFSDRFEREARAIAALNHPNICQIYDVGPDYLVMEFVEGTPIGQVDSTRKLIDIAVQIADGLAAAHAARIIHRDLKPDNILITRDGRVRILDFGLAKRAVELQPDDKTIADITEAGTAVGTIAYMSPEQARGQTDLTPQSDQFALGLILYELAAGRKAFKRASAAETMTAIIREDPEPLPETVPAHLRWIIERLLEKQPAERYDSTRDLYREPKQIRDRMSNLSAAGSAAAVAASASEIPRRANGWPASRVVIAAAAALIIGGAVTWIVKPAATVGRRRFTPIEVSQELPGAGIWSPDGKAFTYGAGAPGKRRVWLRYLNSPTATPLTPPALVWSPLGWSPDSKRVIVAGRNPGGNNQSTALFAVPVFGGEPELIAPLEAKYASMSPDGRILAVIRQEKDQSYAIYTASPPGSELKKYAPAPYENRTVFNNPSVRFSSDNRFLLYIQDAKGGRQVWKLPLPPGSGTPQKVMQKIPDYGGTPTLSGFPGNRLWLANLEDGEGQPGHYWIMGLSGTRRQLTDGSDRQGAPAVSPDGKRILFTQGRTEFLLVSASLADASTERIISSEQATGMPSWARTQEKFVYESDRSGTPAIWMRAEGWDRPLVTVDTFPAGSTVWFMTPALSPGGDRVLYTRIEKGGKSADWISSLSGGPPVRLTNTVSPSEYGGTWSPDGRQYAFIQLDNGKASLAVAKTSGDATPSVIKEVAGGLPVWSPDGHSILFQSRMDGWSLLSPQDKTARALGQLTTIAMTFSADSKLLYGVRVEKEHRYLYSLDPATKAEKVIGDIGQDFTPRSYLNPGTRLSLAPDGKSVLFATYRGSGSLWMLEGFQGPTWTERLREMLPW